MKKLLGIVVLGLIWSTPSFSFNTYLKCTCEHSNLVKSVINDVKKFYPCRSSYGQNPIEYFKINHIFNTIHFAWNSNAQEFDIKKKLIKKTKSTYEYNDNLSNWFPQRINRYTGKAIHNNAFYNCEKINKPPLNEIDQKF
jgi:hypothetical protein